MWWSNPIGEEKTPETEPEVEGCFSIPGMGIKVGRHKGVVASGSDAEGEPLGFATGRSHA